MPLSSLKAQNLEGDPPAIALAIVDGIKVKAIPLLVRPNDIFLVSDRGQELVIVYSMTCLFYGLRGVTFHTDDHHDHCRTWTPAGCTCDVEDGR